MRLTLESCAGEEERGRKRERDEERERQRNREREERGEGKKGGEKERGREQLIDEIEEREEEMRKEREETGGQRRREESTHTKGIQHLSMSAGETASNVSYVTNITAEIAQEVTPTPSYITTGSDTYTQLHYNRK